MTPRPSVEHHLDLRGRSVLEEIDFTKDVLESPASIVFDQPENRLHAIVAAMVAAIGE